MIDSRISRFVRTASHFHIRLLHCLFAKMKHLNQQFCYWYTSSRTVKTYHNTRYHNADVKVASIVNRATLSHVLLSVTKLAMNFE